MATPKTRPPKRPVRARLSHVDADGTARMVDVGGKAVTRREAVARGTITIAPDALALIRSGRIAKGDPLQTARLAGIMAAKRTADLIPLCRHRPDDDSRHPSSHATGESDHSPGDSHGAHRGSDRALVVRVRTA